MVRNYNTLYNLNSVLDRVDPHKQDVVVLHLRFLRRGGGGRVRTDAGQLFSLEEQKLFTRALEIAEKKERRSTSLLLPPRISGKPSCGPPRACSRPPSFWARHPIRPRSRMLVLQVWRGNG